MPPLDAAFIKHNSPDSIRGDCLGFNVKLPALICLPHVTEDEAETIKFALINLRKMLKESDKKVLRDGSLTVIKGPPNLRGAPTWRSGKQREDNALLEEHRNQTEHIHGITASPMGVRILRCPECHFKVDMTDKKTWTNGRWFPIECASCNNCYVASRWLCHSMVPFYTCQKNMDNLISKVAATKKRVRPVLDEVQAQARKKYKNKPGLPGDFDRPKLEGMATNATSAIPWAQPQQRWIPHQELDEFINKI